jgi:hypothetical protein
VPGNGRRAVRCLARDRPPAQTVSTVRPAACFKIETLPSRHLCQSQNSRAVEEDLADLRRQIAAWRPPEPEPVDDQSQGVQLATVQDLANYWATEYD